MNGTNRIGAQDDRRPMRTMVPITPYQTKPAMLAGLE